MTSRICLCVYVVLAMLLLIGGCAMDQNRRDGNSTSMRARANDPSWTDPATMSTRRATQIVGRDVFNHEGAKLGSVQDLVTDTNNHMVQYAVISTGGMMGMGTQMYAVPWQKLEFRSIDTDKVYTDITAAEMKAAPALDANHWPDMGRADSRDAINGYYNIKPDRSNMPNYDDPRVAGHVSNVGAEKNGLLWCRRSSAIIGANVKGTADEALGEIKDFVINSNTGEIRYMVLGFGGTLGFGDKYFAIPVSLLHTEAASERYVLAVSPDRLRNAPGFDRNNWPNFADPQFRENIDRYYGPQVSRAED